MPIKIATLTESIRQWVLRLAFSFLVFESMFASVGIAQNPFSDAINRRNDLLGRLQAQKDTLAPDSILIGTMAQIIAEDQALLDYARDSHELLMQRDSLVKTLQSENEGLSMFMGSWAKSATLLYSVVAGVLFLLLLLSSLLFLARRKNRLLTTEFHSQINRIEGSNKHLQEEIRKVENAFVEKSTQLNLLEKERIQIEAETHELREEINRIRLENETLSHGLYDKSQLMVAVENRLTELSNREKLSSQRIAELEKLNQNLSAALEQKNQLIQNLQDELDKAGQASGISDESWQEANKEIADLKERLAGEEKQKQAFIERISIQEERIGDLESRASRGMLEESRRQLDRLEINLLKLEKLHRLLEINAINQEEFEGMKKQILPELMSSPDSKPE